MPKLFTFKVNNSPKFLCDLKSEQCLDTKKTGARCKCRAIIGYQYCHSHLMYKHKLKVKDSTIPGSGKGLFACDPMTERNEIIFRPKDRIVIYGGEPLDQKELSKRYGEHTAPYALKTGRDRFLDGACRRGVGSLANTRRNRNNAAFSSKYLKATKNIRNGQEIFASYGRSYKMTEPTSHTTDPLRKAHAEQYRYPH